MPPKKKKNQQLLKRLQTEVRQQQQEIKTLLEWKDRLYRIYDLEEVLRWREHMTRWDTWLEFTTDRSGVVSKCLFHVANLPKALHQLVISYEL